jgi:hypothetical protein
MQTTPTPLEWLLLRLIDAQPSWANSYGLTRFMAKTDVCLSFYEDLRSMVRKGWLDVKDPKAQVKQYDTTAEGKRLLAAEYTLAKIKDYVLSIEPTGYIVDILEKMDARLGGTTALP